MLFYLSCPPVSLVWTSVQLETECEHTHAECELDFIFIVPSPHVRSEQSTSTGRAELRQCNCGALETIILSLVVQKVPNRSKLFAQPPPPLSVHYKMRTNQIELKFRTATGSGTIVHCA